MQLQIIARMHSAFPTKYGVPRQSGLADQLQSTIVFEPEFRVDEALRGLQEYSHLWLIWGFSQNAQAPWSPTVRPPRLGGNTRVGVFASRSPFRPNHLGLSSVRLLNIQKTTHQGSVLVVAGADLVDQTPIYDIKPYLSFTDAHPDAKNGFAQTTPKQDIRVHFPQELAQKLTPTASTALTQILAQDPRPAYHHDPERIYGFQFDHHEIHFRVQQNTLTVLSIEPLHAQNAHTP